MRRWGLFFLAVSALGASYRYREYPNPYIYIWDIEDSGKGFLWLAAGDGLYKFHGGAYERVPGFPYIEARSVKQSSDGTLWIASPQGILKYDGEFHVMSDRPSPGPVIVDGNVALYTDRKQLWRVESSGRKEAVENARDVNHASLGLDGYVWFRGRTKGVKWRCLWRVKAHWGAVAELVTCRDQEDVIRAAGDGDRWWGLTEGAYLHFDGKRLHSKQGQSRVFDSIGILARDGKRIYFLGADEIGTDQDPLTFDRGHRSRGKRPTTILQTQDGRSWIARWKFGLICWEVDRDWNYWRWEDLNVSRVWAIPKGRNFSALTKEGLLRREMNTWNLTQGSPAQVSEAVWTSSGLMARTGGKQLALLAMNGEIARKLALGGETGLQSLEIDSAGRILAGGNSLSLVNVQQAALAPIRIAKIQPRIGFGDFGDLQRDHDGRVWAAFEDQLLTQEKEQWHLAGRRSGVDIRSISPGAKGVWFVPRRAGSFGVMQKAGPEWKVQIYAAEDGYLPARTLWIKTDSRGWVWRSVENGVLASNGRDLSPTDWLYLRPENGLDIGEPLRHGILEDEEGSMWIAGSKGVARLKPNEKWFAAPGSRAEPTLGILAQHGNRIKVRVGGLQGNNFFEQPYLYRLRPRFEDWRFVREGIIEEFDLPSAAYLLEVRYAGLGASGIAKLSFRVGANPWNYLWSFLGLALAGSAILFSRFGENLRYRWKKWLFSQRGIAFGEEQNLLADGTLLRDRFRIDSVAAIGGFATLYRAEDLALKNEAAIKVIGATGRDESWVRNRYSQEVNALRTLQHRGIVSLRDHWVSKAGEYMIAMPFLKGESLRHALNKGALERNLAASVIERIGEAISEVHRNDLVHLDLKPENIILTAEGPVLIDFGTSSLRGPEGEMAVTRMLTGSAFYMAPERLSGLYSPASDLYSYGVVVLEILSGKRIAEIEIAWFEQGFEKRLADLIRWQCSPAEETAAILAPCFSAIPQSRPKDASKFGRDIAIRLRA